MSERDYLISKAERDLTSERYKKKRNKNLVIAGGGLASGTVLGHAAARHAATVGTMRGINQARGVAAGGGVLRLAGLGALGAGIYRHGQYVGSARRAPKPVAA